MRALHDFEHFFHFHHPKGPTAMSAVDKIKQFFDAHAPELETLLADAEHAAVALDPALAPVVGLFGELTDGAKALVADVIRALHTTGPTTPSPAGDAGFPASADVTSPDPAADATS